MAQSTRAGCAVDGCPRTKIVGRGMCELHYRRVIRHGDPGTAGRVCGRCGKEFFAFTKGKWIYCPDCRLCPIEDCGRERDRGKFCQRHRNIKYKYGNPDHPGVGTRARRRPIGHVRRHGDGYLSVKMPSHVGANSNGYVLQHRLVMEENLGRLLTADENVHHINGDRADNRLEHLELWNTGQPSGQRIPDKVAWAVALLERYAPDLLAPASVQLKLI